MEEAILARVSILPSAQKNNRDWTGVIFRSHHHVLLTPIFEVVEILPLTYLAMIPGVKPWLRGLAVSRREIFPVTDLAGFISKKNSPFTHKTRILVTKQEEERSGILVDEVLGLQRFINENKISHEIEPIAAFDQFITGTFIQDPLRLPIFSVKALVMSPRFRQAALHAKGMTNLELEE